MTNPAQAIRALITYAVCIPLAMLVGWMLCNPLDYGTLGFFGLIAMLLVSPMLIRWHYPLMVFGLGSPIFCFFLQGNPPLSQVAVILCLSIAIIDRTMNSNKRFMSVPVMTWPLHAPQATTPHSSTGSRLSPRQSRRWPRDCSRSRRFPIRWAK